MAESVQIQREGSVVVLACGPVRLHFDPFEAQKVAQALNCVVADIDIPKTARVDKIVIATGEPEPQS